MGNSAMDNSFSITYRNVDGARIIHRYDDYLSFLTNCASDDSDLAYTWDDEVLLVVLGGQVVYSSLGKKRQVTITDVYKWLGFYGTGDAVLEDLRHSYYHEPGTAEFIEDEG